jgi:hypothetical protein
MEATPVFYHLAIFEVVTSECWDYMRRQWHLAATTIDCHLFDTPSSNGHDLKDLLGIFPGIITLTTEI